MKRIIDVSLAISADLLRFPGNPRFEMLPVKRIASGGTSNVSEARLGTHAGTHVDPPRHFINDGASAEALPLEALVGDAVVADLRHVENMIEPSDLEALALPPDIERLLLLTRNSELWSSSRSPFPDSYVAVSGDAARWLVERGIRLVGIDFLSIEARNVPGHPTHNTLLGAGVVIVEGLNLFDVEPGRYTFVCLPLKMVGADGAPARAILIQG